MGLTIKGIEALGEGRYSDGGGVGLMLFVSATGSKTWVQRLTISGKRREIGLGGFPTVTLAKARETALANKRSVLAGQDPLLNKRQARAAAAKRLTFDQAVERACAELAPGWKGEKEAASFLSSLSTYANPFFGEAYVADITSAEIRIAVQACRAKVPNLSVKVQQRIHAVFKWAVATGLRDSNPATSEALALPKFEQKKLSNRALPYGEVAAAIATVKASRAWISTKLALEFTVITAARSGEVRGAAWAEIDMGAGVWTVPGERMKMGREHRVPLSDAALEVLRQAAAYRDGSDLVFPSVRGRELSDSTLSKLLRELGVNSTVHGFRASFRTWCQERTNVAGEVAEAALAHVKQDKTEAVYARSDLFGKRRGVMDAWASFLCSEGDVDNVVILGVGS